MPQLKSVDQKIMYLLDHGTCRIEVLRNLGYAWSESSSDKHCSALKNPYIII